MKQSNNNTLSEDFLHSIPNLNAALARMSKGDEKTIAIPIAHMSAKHFLEGCIEHLKDFNVIAKSMKFNIVANPKDKHLATVQCLGVNLKTK